MKVAVTMTVSRGAAGSNPKISIPYFVAVTRGGEVIAKAPLFANIEFSSGVNQMAYTSETVTLALPTTKDVSAAAFDLRAGFQLSDDQLAYNRAHRAP